MLLNSCEKRDFAAQELGPSERAHAQAQIALFVTIYLVCVSGENKIPSPPAGEETSAVVKRFYVCLTKPFGVTLEGQVITKVGERELRKQTGKRESNTGRKREMHHSRPSLTCICLCACVLRR